MQKKARKWLLSYILRGFKSFCEKRRGPRVAAGSFALEVDGGFVVGCRIQWIKLDKEQARGYDKDRTRTGTCAISPKPKTLNPKP